MDNATPLTPYLKRQFALLADYLGKAQKVAREISRSQSPDFGRFMADLTPPRELLPEDAWFWSDEWQAKEQEVNDSIARGAVQRFDDVEELLADLNS